MKELQVKRTAKHVFMEHLGAGIMVILGIQMILYLVETEGWSRLAITMCMWVAWIIIREIKINFLHNVIEAHQGLLNYYMEAHAEWYEKAIKLIKEQQKVE